MCTVTLVDFLDGFVLTMNRDEIRDKQEAGLRTIRQGDIEYCYPVDGAAGGTWVGVNNRGVVLALLNRYQAPTRGNAASRGEIIAGALGLGDMESVLSYLKALPVDQYNPFDCLLVNADQAYRFSWDRTQYQCQSMTGNSSLMLTSSSERLEEVRAYREQQFSQWQTVDGNSAENIDQFHLQQSNAMHRSAVYMAREETHTKSLVQISVAGQHSRLDYYDQAVLQSNSRLAQLRLTDTHQMSVLSDRCTGIAV